MKDIEPALGPLWVLLSNLRRPIHNGYRIRGRAEKTSGHWLLTGNLSIGNSKGSVILQSSGSSKACPPKEQAVQWLGER